MESKHPRLVPWPRIILIIATLALAIILLRTCSHSQHAPFANEYSKSGGDTLDIAIEMNPTIYQIVGDTIQGLDYQKLSEISAQHSLPMKFHPFVDLSATLEGLDQGMYDMVVASLPLTSDLNEKYLMTEPIYLNREILVQLKDSVTHKAAITTQLDLAGDTVWIAAESPFADRIANLASEIGDTIYIQSNPDYGAEHLFILVAKGKIRMAVVNETIAKAMHSDYPMVDISTPISFTQFQSWAIRNDAPALRDSINSWLAH